MIQRRNFAGEFIEVKFSFTGKKLVRIEGNTTRVYDLADEVVIKRPEGQKHTFTVTPENRTWKFGMGGLAYIKG